MTISLRVNDKESELIKNYAYINNVSVSELIRQIILEKIENEYDLKAYQEAIEYNKEHPEKYSFEEIEKKYIS